MARVAGNQGWVDAMVDEIGKGASVSTVVGGFIIHVPCCACCQTVDYKIPRRYPPNVFRQKIEQYGWTTGKHLTCPACVEKQATAKKLQGMIVTPVNQQVAAPAVPKPVTAQAPVKPKPTPVANTQLSSSTKQVERVNQLGDLGKLLPVVKLSAVPATATAPVAALPTTPKVEPEVQAKEDTKVQNQVSAAAKVAHRNVMQLLEEYYNAGEQGYRCKNGKPYSDQQIAQETGAALKHVAETREKWFGPLKTNQPNPQLESEISKLQTQIQEFTRNATVAAEEFTRNAAAAAAVMQAQLDNLKRQYGNYLK